MKIDFVPRFVLYFNVIVSKISRLSIIYNKNKTSILVYYNIK